MSLEMTQVERIHDILPLVEVVITFEDVLNKEGQGNT